MGSKRSARGTGFRHSRIILLILEIWIQMCFDAEGRPVAGFRGYDSGRRDGSFAGNTFWAKVREVAWQFGCWQD